MVLTSQDLIKIEEILISFFSERLDRIEQKLKEAKKERSEMKDVLITIRGELDTEHELRYKKLEETAMQTVNNTQDIKVLKNRLNVST